MQVGEGIFDTTTISILMNGSAIEEFSLERGLR